MCVCATSIEWHYRFNGQFTDALRSSKFVIKLQNTCEISLPYWNISNEKKILFRPLIVMIFYSFCFVATTKTIQRNSGFFILFYVERNERVVVIMGTKWEWNSSTKTDTFTPLNILFSVSYWNALVPHSDECELKTMRNMKWNWNKGEK